MSTKYIQRLSLGLHTALICRFIKSLPHTDGFQLQQDISECRNIDKYWENFERFVIDGCQKNGTFALHVDMMKRCDEVAAIALAERMGGPLGYRLLVAAVKSSLPFSYLNGATSYAAYTTRLLHDHFKCGTFYQHMKTALFSTPVKDSDINFAFDAQREMEHKDVLKAFRSGSTASSVIPRMSLIDSLNEIHDQSRKNTSMHGSNAMPIRNTAQLLGLELNKTDLKYVLRIVGLILRQDGFSLDNDEKVYNVYNKKRLQISRSILDAETEEVGHFLIKKYIVQTGLFNTVKSNQPGICEVKGPKELLQKLRLSKGTTLKRTSAKIHALVTEREKKEEKRKKIVNKEAIRIDCLSSEMNACQAIVKPDCSKPKVNKSAGVSKALTEILVKAVSKHENTLSMTEKSKLLEEKSLVFTGKKAVPRSVQDVVTTATVEFAGVKFKAKSTTGNQYLKYVENSVILRAKAQFYFQSYDSWLFVKKSTISLQMISRQQLVIRGKLISSSLV